MEALGWISAIVGSPYFEIYISVASMAVALWFGLYLLRRGAGTTIGLLSAATALLLSLIYALESMLDAPGITAHEYEILLRTQGLIVPTPITIWVCLSFLIRNNRRITSSVKRVWLIVGIIGASQVWLRALTNWHYDYANIYSSPYPWQDWWTPPAKLYFTFPVFVLGSFAWSSYNIFRPFYDEVGSVRGITKVRQFWPLFSGIVLFVVSMGYMMVAYALDIHAPEVIGLAGVTLGVMALGFGVFWHNTFIEEGRDITSDFLRSLAANGAVLVLWGVIIYVVSGFEHLGPGGVVLIVAAVVIIQSLPEVCRALFDRILELVGLSNWTSGNRQRREILLRAQSEKASREALRERLAVLLDQLCREVSTNRGFVALYNGKGLEVQGIYGPLTLSPTVSLSDLIGRGMSAIPIERQVGDLRGMGIIVPLSVQDRQVGIIVLGEKRYDDSEINRMIVHAEAMQHAIEEVQVAEEIGKLQRRLERLQRLQEPDTSSEEARNLLTVCTKSGLTFKNPMEVVTAANDLLEGYDDPFVLEKSPFIKSTRVQSRVTRGRDRADAVDILEEEIVSTIAAMKPSRSHGYDRRRWIYLNRRFIDQYDDRGDRYTMERIATDLRVSRRTLTRHHDGFIRDFVLAFLDPNRPSDQS